MKLTFEEGQHLSILMIEDDEGNVYQIGTALNGWAEKLQLKGEEDDRHRPHETD